MAVRLLDTNVVSYLTKGHPIASAYQPHLTGHTLAVSFQTAAELLAGAARAGRGAARRATLETTLRSILILHTDRAVCDTWAAVRLAREPQPIGAADAWIAATALAHGLELVTHNPADFRGIPGLVVITAAP